MFLVAVGTTGWFEDNLPNHAAAARAIDEGNAKGPRHRQGPGEVADATESIATWTSGELVSASTGPWSAMIWFFVAVFSGTALLRSTWR